MKSAEDFRKDFGETEEGFRQCIRQTLTELECEEVKPVKKKISMGFVLAAAIMLLAVGAVAAGQWGILEFMSMNGYEPNPDSLVTQVPQYMNRESKLLNVTVEEALWDGERLYLAVYAQPKKSGSLVIPYVEDAAAPGSMKVMDNPDYDHNLSVTAYAEAFGYERVIGLEVRNKFVLPFSTRNGSDFAHLEFAAYDHLEDGTLRMILQYGYHDDEMFPFPERSDMISLEMQVVEYTAEGKLPHWSEREYFAVNAELALYASKNTRRSIPEDAHDVAGYRGAIKYVSVTPVDDEVAAVSIMMDMTRLENDDLWMTGPRWVLLTEDGQRLGEVTLGMSTGVALTEDVLHHGTIPAEAMPGDRFILRLENRNNYNIVYDEHTYTLK